MCLNRALKGTKAVTAVAKAGRCVRLVLKDCVGQDSGERRKQEGSRAEELGLVRRAVGSLCEVFRGK